MALYQNGILISGANTLPQMTLAEYQALPVSERPTYWERTDLNYNNMFTEMTLSVNETIQVANPTNKNLGACPSGYTLLSVYWVRDGSEGGNVFSVSCYLYNGNVIVTIANEYTQAVTFYGTLHVVLRKTS